jgi:hypothetical protein
MAPEKKKPAQKNPGTKALAQSLPQWALGPSTALTEEQGEELVESDEILLDSCEIRSDTGESTTVHVRTKDGLFHWPRTLLDILDYDDEGEDDGDDTRRDEPGPLG